MDQPDLVAQGLEAGTPFGAVFAAYSKAFSTRDTPGLLAAFAVDAQVTLRDDRQGTTEVVSPSDFFDRLEREVGPARFVIEACTARFGSGYLFADGLWVKPEGEALLRAADFFTAGEEGRFASLSVVWAAPD